MDLTSPSLFSPTEENKAVWGNYDLLYSQDRIQTEFRGTKFWGFSEGIYLSFLLTYTHLRVPGKGGLYHIGLLKIQPGS